MTLPSLAQLTRFRKRCEKAHDALESASYFLLEAIRVYDGDKIPTKFDAAMAWESAHSTEAAIDALKSLLAVAEDYADKAIVEGTTRLTTSPPPEPIGVVRAPRQNPGETADEHARRVIK